MHLHFHSTRCILIASTLMVCQTLFLAWLFNKFQQLYDCHDFADHSIDKNLPVTIDCVDTSIVATPTSTCVNQSDKARSAFERAKSLECKQLIEKTTCLLLNDQLFAKLLDSQCPGQKERFASALGCFKDNREPFLHANTSFALSSKQRRNQLDQCGHACLRYGFAYFGAEDGQLCFCLHQVPWSNAVDAKHCNVKCLDGRACGGYFAANLYQTGLIVDRQINQFQPELSRPNATQVNATEIRIAFVLLLTGRNLDQILRLLHSIYRPKHLYHIHVDSQSKYLYWKLKEILPRRENIFFSQHRFETIWGGAQLLDAVIHSVHDLLTQDAGWQYVINLSESDFPIQNVESLELYLLANIGKNFLKHHGYQDNRRFLTKQGIEKTFVQCDRRMWLLGNRQLPGGLVYSGGSDWFALYRDFAAFMVKSDNALVDGLRRLFSFTLLPVESFLHTLLQNSPFCGSMVNNNLRLTNWKRSSGCKCQHRPVVDWCGCSPNVFKSPSDFNRIRAAGQKNRFFARKFDSTLGNELISLIENQLLSTRRSGRGWKALQESVWLNLYSFSIEMKKSSVELLASGSSFTLLALLSFNLTLFDDFQSFGQQISSYPVRDAFYHQSDRVPESLIISFYDPIQRTDIEMLAVPIKQKPLKNHFNEHFIRLVRLQVCSQFDVKERVFRKYGCILSPFDIPSVFHEWSRSDMRPIDSFVVKFIWFDPSGNRADSFEIDLNTNSSAGQLSELTFVNTMNRSSNHLKPGEWRLCIFNELDELLHDNPFLVTPLLKLIPSNHFAHDNHNAFADSWVCVGGVNELCRRELLHWKRLMTHFWSLKAICSTRPNRQTKQPPACTQQHWSPSLINDLTLG